MPETAYNRPDATGRLAHAYGDNVHILSDPWALSLLARIGSPDVRPPEFNDLIAACYRRLLRAATEVLPTIQASRPTRMAAIEPLAVYEGAVIDPKAKVVVVDVIRGGILPAHVFQQELLRFLDPDAVRVDHLFMERIADPIDGHVTGVDMPGAKIGGGIDGATLLVPDPMGATGGSVAALLDYYKENIGAPRAIAMCHLMVTPEYLRRVQQTHPDAHVYALRVDRGLSGAEVLQAMPGARWDDERGLTDNDYIVPGAGGVGELLYNA